jgi:ABC-type Mn2+/Zn2+ transport system ATPase subunit
VNGAGKTTQLQIVMGRLQPDGGEIIKAKRHMKIAYLAQVRIQCSQCSQ